MRPINLIVIHHSASPLSTTREDIAAWHRAKGWRDIGYHFVIESDGRVVPGRPLEEVGAHARGHNASSIGICAVGDNTKLDQRWTVAQVAALCSLVDTMSTQFPGALVRGHRDVMNPGYTECPGLTAAELAELLS